MQALVACHGRESGSSSADLTWQRRLQFTQIYAISPYYITICINYRDQLSQPFEMWQNST